MKIVIKVGTQSILSNDGTPILAVMNDLVEQIVQLQKAGHHVILVSSGAVGSGRKVAKEVLAKQYGSTVGEKQLLASLGQPELMHLYTTLFKSHHILVSQLLLTKHDFQTRRHYLNIARLLNEILHHKNIVPVINENDSVAIEELMFTDNDELAGLIAAQINADLLIILTNVEGIYTGNPENPDSQLIPVIDPDKGWPEVSTSKSAQGRGGMLSKLATARKMSNLGILTAIAGIHIQAVITRIAANELVGTTILARKKQTNIKRWIAYNRDKKMGSISINACLYALLNENTRAFSILPVGIETCHGDFKGGDLVEIMNPQGEVIGIGIAKYDAKKLSEYFGVKNKPAFIHYDHLHIF